MYDVEKIRVDFPILSRSVNGKPLVYLDNGASAQKPKAVIDAMTRAYEAEYANVHRGIHFLSNAATQAYEDAREIVRRFLNAKTAEEIVFSASVDLHQIRGYGLGEAETELLMLLAIWEVVAFLDEPMRLRTACDLEVDEITVRRPDGYLLPSRSDLESAIAALEVKFKEPGERRVVWAKGK